MAASIELLIDNPTREMLPGLFARSVLERLGDFALHFDHQDLSNDGRSYDFFRRTRKRRDVLITPNYHVRRRRDIFLRALRMGARGIVVQHSEQFFSPLFDREKLNLDYRDAYNRQVAAHLVWGETFARRLVEKAGVSPEKIYIVGNPKLELARRFQGSGPSGAEPPTVLVASDFNLGDLSGARWDRFKTVYSIRTDVPVHDRFHRARERTVDWLMAIAAAHPGIRFLMRPHPGERPLPYRCLEGIPNIEMTGQDPIGHDLERSAMMFCFTSSSLFEAMAMNRPVYSLAVETLPEACRPTYYDDLPWIGLEEMEALVADLEQGRTPAPQTALRRKMEAHVWNARGNTLLTSALGMHAAASRILHLGAWSWRTGAAGRIGYAIPAVKCGALGIAYGLYRATGWKNPLYREMRGRWEERVRAGDFLTEGMIEGAERMARQILDTPGEEALERGYCLRETDWGRYVEPVPDDAPETDREVQLAEYRP